ncbi:MAG: sigma-70 family RNA polymerase sigma factor [Dysgonamonadaceae bacterium]|jgi:RNA polymerase sigma-70 factor (ECF subfamily)|nr:sigma-70 family RNA polymerase sigma factor [Dysgonamonadaceae bacterium]
MKTNSVEQQLIEGLKAGDYACYNRIYMEYYNKLYFFVENIVCNRNDAEDIVQEVFIKLWTNRELIVLHTSLSGYLFQMARNKALNFIRDEKNRRIILLEKRDEDILFGYGRRPAGNDFSEALEKYLSRLYARGREILLMYYVDGYKQKEIAEKLGISVQTVKNHICVSLKRLKEFFKENDKTGL